MEEKNDDNPLWKIIDHLTSIVAEMNRLGIDSFDLSVDSKTTGRNKFTFNGKRTNG